MQVSEKFTIFDRFDILFHTVSSKCGVLFPYIKRTICIFLAFAIFFNVFVTKNCEFKNKFLVALNCAINIIESTVFNEYTDALMRTISGAVKDLSVIIQKTLANQDNNKNNPIPVSTNNSNNEVILTKRINDGYNTITFIKSNILYSIYDVIKQGNIFYKNVIINCKKELDRIGMLIFILFSIFIVRMKGIVYNKATKNIKVIGYRLA